MTAKPKLKRCYRGQTGYIRFMRDLKKLWAWEWEYRLNHFPSDGTPLDYWRRK